MARLSNRNSLCTHCLILANNLQRDVGTRSQLYRMPAEELRALFRELRQDYDDRIQHSAEIQEHARTTGVL